MTQFKYDSLNLEQHAFRLVRLQQGVIEEVIRCELVHTIRDENVIPYEAVSYTWGSTEKTDAIYIQGATLDVTRNLFLILHDLRYSKVDRYLWIDAICINQDNVHERGHQVQQMKSIYSDADRVLFCVGRPTGMTRILMSSLADLQNLTRGNNWTSDDPRWNWSWEIIQDKMKSEYPHLRDSQRQGLEYLLAQSWFHRVWVLQEVGNAKAATVYCGRESIPARVFSISPQLLGVQPNSHCQAVLELMPGPLRKRSGQDKDYDLYSLLQKFSKAEAQDDRDKVYALLGLCRDSEASRFVPDYEKTVQEVIHQTISHIYPHSRLNMPECPSFRRGLIRWLVGLPD
ncbi:heterokaryon incompatibility protein-domain-containing protein [Hypoxylon rubiginosum]|uniref:Heterokaryon incompatibility protein-domain-containing protein n=1 Tax=Hypoxylon rubiginosum TaxID=110542 RepID=A0ACB9YMI9_9PEZI|nr:heterokaryon incompatibility protein-domain-containing protein [Hypoxylon rubiginosum]